MQLWSKEEILFLKENYPSNGIKFCAQKLGRSDNSIKLKASKLKVKSLNKKLKDPEVYNIEIKSKGYTCLEPYINRGTALLHKHDQCGYEWRATPNDLLYGKTICPGCSKSAYKCHLPGTLYFVSTNIGLYKLGITNKTPRIRLGSDWPKFNMKLEWELTLPNGREIKDLEKLLLTEYKNNLVNTGLLKSGNTETLNIYIPKPD